MAKRSSRKAKPAAGVAVAIFDDRCGMCRRFGGLLRRMVGPDQLEVVPCGSALQRRLAPGISVADCRKAFTLIQPDGRVLIEGEAASKAIALAPSLAPFRWMVDGKAGQGVARQAYRAVRLLRPRE